MTDDAVPLVASFSRVIAIAGTQAPARQRVSIELSLQATPSAGGCATPARQKSFVHTLPSSGCGVPSGALPVPHTLFVHVRTVQPTSAPGQSEATTHATQAPTPSHTPPGQVVSAISSTCVGPLLVQPSVVHALPSSAISVSSSSGMVLPAPSHTAILQSPGVWAPAVSGVPDGVFVTLHEPVMQWRCSH